MQGTQNNYVNAGSHFRTFTKLKSKKSKISSAILSKATKLTHLKKCGIKVASVIWKKKIRKTWNPHNRSEPNFFQYKTLLTFEKFKVLLFLRLSGIFKNICSNSCKLKYWKTLPECCYYWQIQEN